MRKCRHWMARLLLWVTGLTVLTGISVAGVVYSARANGNLYSCLDWSGYSVQRGKLLDLASGKIVNDPRPLITGPDDYFRRDESKDGKYVAYLIYDPRKSSELYIQPINDPNVLPMLIETHNVLTFAWSPDSRYVAYISITNKDMFIGMVNADGSHKKVVQITGGSPLLIRPLWSSDSAYVAISVSSSQVTKFYFYSVSDLHLTISPSRAADPYHMVWSPQGHRLAYLNTIPAKEQYLSLFSPEDGKETIFKLAIPPIQPIFQWSPDSRYLLMGYLLQWPNYRFDLFGVDGSVFPDLAESTIPNRPLDMPSWSVDGNNLILLDGKNVQNSLGYVTGRRVTPDGNNVVVFHTQERRLETIVENLHHGLFYTHDHSHVAMIYYQGDQFSVDLLVQNLTQRIPFISNADSTGDPYWSPDNKTVAIVWATGQRQQRVVHLSWANAAGSNNHDLTEDFWDVRDLVWLQGGRALTYIAWHRDGFSVEIVDLQTGQIRHLVDNLVDATWLKIEPTGEINFRWRSADGNSGMDGYQPDGTLAYRFRISGSMTNLLDNKITLSPDRHMAALKLGPQGHESLQLASSDGQQPRLIRSGLTGLGDPLWSPDSRSVAFTQSIAQGPITLEVVNTAGVDIRQIPDNSRSNFYNLRWTQCD